MPDETDVFQLKQHELPVEKEDYNFNESYIDEEEIVYMTTDSDLLSDFDIDRSSEYSVTPRSEDLTF